MNAETQFRKWEKQLASDDVPKRASEEHARSTLRAALKGALKSVEYSIKGRRGGAFPKISVDVLSLWDLTALVGAPGGARFALGVGFGTAFLLDAACAFLCSFLFFSGSARATDAQNRLGAILYDYARAKTYRLRHWMLDPTINRVHPYGIVPVNLAAEFPKDIASAHQFYLEVLVRWILSHEIAHILAGDLEAERDVLVMGMSGNEVTVRATPGRSDQELAADFEALCTVVSIYPGQLPRVFTAISYFIGIMHIVDTISVRPMFAGPAHPSPLERLDNLIDRLHEASPKSTDSEIKRTASIGKDFARFSNEIATDILRVPQAYRLYAFMIEDVQEDSGENGLLAVSARKNDEGDAMVAKGNLEGAIVLYLEAFEQIATVRDWGEGHRIVLGNIIETYARLGLAKACCTWAQKGIDQTIRHNDKPALAYLARIYKGAFRYISEADIFEDHSALCATIRVVDETLVPNTRRSSPRFSRIFDWLNRSR